MERSFHGVLKTCNFSLLSLPETEKMFPNVQSHYRKVTEGAQNFFVNLNLRLSEIGNGGHCPGLDNDSTRGFSDAVVGDGFAIDRII